MKSKIIMVGGFLGAGKTTLLWKAAEFLAKDGSKVGLITNDQAAGLVDTALLKRVNDDEAEVNGSCFCCNFDGFINAVKETAVDGAGTIIAEPVGSCTDLSATIMQPLKDHFSENIETAPLTVLVDPDRLRSILSGGVDSGLHPSALYIIDKQMEEADIIAINKSDLLSEDEIEDLIKQASQKWPLAKLISLSAKTGQGIDEWLEKINIPENSGSHLAGSHLAKIDYDIYAEGEAVLGWLNITGELSSTENVLWDNFAKELLNNLFDRFSALGAPVGHVKLMLESGENKYMVRNITAGIDALSLRNSAGITKSAVLTLNARVQMKADVLKEIAVGEMENICGDDVALKITALNCLTPGRPNPTHRYDRVVLR